MKTYRKIFILLSTLFVLGFAVTSYQKNTQALAIVKSFGTLNVIFPSTPVFNESNWQPGKTTSKSISVENTDIFDHHIGVKAVNFHDTGATGLSSGLSIIITDGTNILYGQGSPTGPKTLADFYAADTVWLNLQSRHSKKNYIFIIGMPNSSGNEFQNSSTTFDLILGVDSEDNQLKSLPTLKPLPTLPPLPTLLPFPTLKPLNRILPTLAPLPTLRSIR